VRPASFVPVIGAISPGEAYSVPGLEETISYWTEGTRPAEEWLDQRDGRWGTAGFVMRRGEETLGFVVYGQREHLPRAGRFPLGPLEEDAVLLAYVGGDPRTRRRLLVRMLRDLRHRGVGRVEAITSDRGLPHHVPTPVLLESGWRPVRRAPYRRSYYTLMRTDLGSAVEVGEMARALIGRVKLPALKKSVPAPGGALSHMSRMSRVPRAAGTRGGR
jgi:hypothetical protein